MEIKDRVLIVEDDKNIRKFIQTILEANDYDVIATETGKEAYSLITSRCPDVVILDLGLPDMDGMKILKEVRAWSNMPIIVVSARDHEKDKVEALDMGADDNKTIWNIRTSCKDPGCDPTFPGNKQESGREAESHIFKWKIGDRL